MNNRIINCYSTLLLQCHLSSSFFQYPLSFFWQNPTVDVDEVRLIIIKIIIIKTNIFSRFLLIHPICTPMMFSIVRTRTINSCRKKRIINVSFRLNPNSFFDQFPIRNVLHLHLIVYLQLLRLHHLHRKFLRLPHNHYLFVDSIEVMFKKNVEEYLHPYFSILLIK